MKDTKLLLALSGLQPTPVWIASTVLKNKDRKDIREFLAKVVDEGDTVRIVLEETVRELRDTHNFFIEEGSELRTKDASYKCTYVTDVKLGKKHPLLLAKRIA
ncbi:MAG: hypothetical protein IJI25_04905 [Eubacterium sp.]|jgi:hypothetical protein|nr:hypothetical protein [Eubacterium sp.]